MTQEAQISSRIDAELKRQGDSILAELGINSSQAITIEPDWLLTRSISSAFPKPCRSARVPLIVSSKTFWHPAFVKASS